MVQSWDALGVLGESCGSWLSWYHFLEGAIVPEPRFMDRRIRRKRKKGAEEEVEEEIQLASVIESLNSTLTKSERGHNEEYSYKNGGEKIVTGTLPMKTSSNREEETR